MSFTNQAFSTQLKCCFNHKLRILISYSSYSQLVPFQSQTGAGIYIIYGWNPSCQAGCVLLDRQQNGRKKKAKLWPLRKGPFDQQLDYSNQLRKGKKKKAPKRGARRPDYFDRHHRAGGAPWARAANFVKKPPLIVNVTYLELNGFNASMWVS